MLVTYHTSPYVRTMAVRYNLFNNCRYISLQNDFQSQFGCNFIIRAKMSDFLDWDDSDVDWSEILGEWTDYGINSGSDSWSEDDCKTPSTHSKPCKRKKNFAENISPAASGNSAKKSKYKCPLCQKLYETVGGFRGHVIKKHDRPDLKASEFKLANHSSSPSSPSSDTVQSSKQDESSQSKSSVVKEHFQECLHSAAKEVQNNINHRSKNSKSGATIISISEAVGASPDALKEIGSLLLVPFMDIFSVFGSRGTFSSDMEVLWSKYHNMRTNFELCANLRSAVMSISPESERNVHLFIQCFLDDLIRCVISKVTRKFERDAVSDTVLKDEDNSVIFYIGGYLISAVGKQAKRLQKSNVCDVLDKLLATSSDPSPSFMTKYKRWTEKVNRGGLKICGDNFFYMLRKMEIICRANIDLGNLNAHSIPKDTLMDAIIRDTTVTYYWDKLVVCRDELKMSILENIVSIFLRLRGRAVAKYVQRQTQKEKADTARTKQCRKSHSLRKSLKEYSKN